MVMMMNFAQNVMPPARDFCLVSWTPAWTFRFVCATSLFAIETNLRVFICINKIIWPIHAMASDESLSVPGFQAYLRRVGLQRNRALMTFERYCIVLNVTNI